MSGADEFKWTGRIPRHKIKTLYERDAQGIIDEELIDEIGLSLYARCDSVITATNGYYGKVKCPRCGIIIEHTFENIVCSCSWETSFTDYIRKCQGKKLHGGGSLPELQRFMDEYSKARTPQDKMLAIDRLIHVFHYQANFNHSRPVACNVIGGSTKEILQLLNELAYSEKSTQGTSENLQLFKEELPKSTVYYVQQELEQNES